MISPSLYRLFAKSANCPKCQQCCWSCHQLLQGKGDHIFCNHCHKIQPPPCTNYFSIFNQPKKYDIDLNALQQRYKKYQILVHPDRYFNKSSQEMDYADKFAQTVNRGFETLKNPISRAEYLLGLYDRQPNMNVPPEFLAEVLEIHEQVADSSDPKQLKEMLDDINKRMEEEKRSLSLSLSVTENDKLKDPDAACVTLSKMRYYNRIRDLIKTKLPASSV